MTCFLRFADEATFVTACESAGLWISCSAPRPLLLSHTHILDVIGTITEGGEWDPETGEEITSPTVLEAGTSTPNSPPTCLPTGTPT